jgi:lipoate-protein ligase A
LIPYRLLDAGPMSAAHNMALDEVLTIRAGKGLSPPTLRFLQFSPDAALVGYNQQVARELRVDYCRANGIDLGRRITGGGALLFQSSALGWELVAPQGVEPFVGDYATQVRRICEAAAKGLSCLGFEARFRPRNDIEVEGRKISGTGGTVLEGGVLFQGTVLIENQIERFLRALRVPVEKLKKREIDSLMQRLAFVDDLLGRPTNLAELKHHLARALAEELGLELYEGGLSKEEKAALDERLPYFQSEEWLRLKEADSGKPAWLKEILQTDNGTLWVNLWLDLRGRLVQKALINGDFFTRPQRLILDLEAALMGKKAQPGVLHRAVMDFFAQAGGELVGIDPADLAQAVANAAARRSLIEHFSPKEAAELFLVGLEPGDLGRKRAGWLLLPYCAKPVDCELRKVPDCDLCGQCDFEHFFRLADELNMKAVSIQSFEHLMEVLRGVSQNGGLYVGSCCEAFYTKHQKEMEDCGARGLLVNVDSTTCYDLGKGMEAYVGVFDHQTDMNLELLEKAARIMAG